jgi:uroporphyrinogen-III decarboxylase
VYAQISQHSARLIGAPTIEFFRSAKSFLRAELAADLFYGIDGPTTHYDVYNIEAEAMGARLLWNEGQIPAVDPRAPLLDSVDAFERLHPVRTGKVGRMPYVLEMNARLKDMGLAPKVRFTGLFTLAANLVGLEELVLAIMTKPEKVRGLMRFLTHEIVAPWIVRQREECGSRETATGSDALASPPLTTVSMVREFCLQYIEELERLLGGVRLAGLWGEAAIANPTELLDIKTAGSPGSIQVLDPDVTALGPAFFSDYAARTGVSLIMGMDANLLATGPASDIGHRARRFIEEGGRNGRFVLFMNDVPYDTPPENVLTVVRTAGEYRLDPDAAGYRRVQGPPQEEGENPREYRGAQFSIEDALEAVDRMMAGN